MIFAVAVADMDTGRYVPQQVDGSCAMHAVIFASQVAGMISLSEAVETLRAGDLWAVALADAGVAFCVTQLTRG